ncbi:alpha/beta hydrolase [Agromyces marinus]|uniref:Alpha/beta hydrolase n=1 Tax=Agromyces marinus TaxID=1389020 RepID=A0ABN6YFD4_9MICO|nr:alpha/beta hydrolase [Agromyces marinus]UIP58950.1 Acetyl esterase [Agromyces marinus]BDZ56084.1 alpha/beta hydrolase [Agromyces marinus]
MPASFVASERLIRGVIRTLGALPEPVQRVIAGRPVVVDGQRLYTEVQMALRLLNALPGSDFSDHSLERARAQIDSEARIFGGSMSVATVEDIEIPTRAGAVAGRRYLNAREAEGTVVYFHGGGWVLGSLDSADSVCRFIAATSGLEVISVDYRLAPEHPFPAAVEDAIDSYHWVRENRPNSKVAVAGDSAGGNLSAVVSLATVGDPAGAPDFQLLFFPVTDLADKRGSYRLFSDGYFLTEKQMDWYREHYLARPADALDPFVSPLHAEATALAGLPPAHVAVSGFDVLRDEGIAYAERLKDAGVPTTLQVVEGHIHAFVNATGVGRLSSQALAEATGHLVRGLGRD